MVDMLRSERETWFGYQGIGILAFVLLTLTIVKPIEIGVAAAATGILIASPAAGSWGPSTAQRTRIAGLIVAGLVLALGLAVWQLGPFVAAISAILLPLALATGFLSWKGKLEERGPRLLALIIFQPIEIGAAVAATGILIASRAAGSWGPTTAERTRIAGLVVAGFVLAAGLAVWQLGPFVAVISAILLPLALATGFLSLKGKLEERGPRLLAVGLLVVMVMTIGFIRIVAFDPPVIDVIDLHVSAADACSMGRTHTPRQPQPIPARRQRTAPFGWGTPTHRSPSSPTPVPKSSLAIRDGRASLPWLWPSS